MRRKLKFLSFSLNVFLKKNRLDIVKLDFVNLKILNPWKDPLAQKLKDKIKFKISQYVYLKIKKMR